MKIIVQTSSGLWPNGIAVIRIITGIFLIYHGTQMFVVEDMKGYEQWLTDLGVPLAGYLPYLGKTAELLGGTSLVLGLFTRMACLVLIPNFLFIAFVMGHGRIFNDSQHSFLFAMLATTFLFLGPGPWSLDKKIWGENKS